MTIRRAKRKFRRRNRWLRILKGILLVEVFHPTAVVGPHDYAATPLVQDEDTTPTITIEVDGKKIEIPDLQPTHDIKPAFVRRTIDIEDYIAAQAVTERDYFNTWVSEPNPGGFSNDELQRMQKTIRRSMDPVGVDHLTEMLASTDATRPMIVMDPMSNITPTHLIDNLSAIAKEIVDKGIEPYIPARALYGDNPPDVIVDEAGVEHPYHPDQPIAIRVIFK